jgi:cell division protein FtsB
MKAALLTGALLLLLGFLQMRLWLGPGSLEESARLRRAIAAQERENAELEERNRGLAAEVHDLKDGLEAIEERARAELGMTRSGETFYLVVEDPQ